MTTLRYRLGVARYRLSHFLRISVARFAVRRLASSRLDEAFAGKRILIISPHPDDEVLGCGALIARCSAAGTPPPRVVIMSGGGASLGADYPDKQRVVDERIKLTDRALTALGLPPSCLTRLFLEDSHMTEEIADPEKLASALSKVREACPSPDIILVPSVHGEFPDHCAAHQFGVLLREDYLRRGHRPELWNFCVWMWFYHPLRLARQARRCLSLVMSHEEHEAKRQALDIYVSPDPATGIYWSGRLPKDFVSAHRWNRETYYREEQP